MINFSKLMKMLKIKKMLLTILLLIVSLILSVIPLAGVSFLISDHFYVWMDNVSSTHFNSSAELILELSARIGNEEFIQKLKKITDSQDSMQITITTTDKQKIFHKSFSQKYQERGVGQCISINNDEYVVTYCSPGHPSSWYSFKKYISCLFNGEVFAKYSYTDYLLLHVSLALLMIALFNNYRVHRKNVLIEKIISRLTI